MKKEPFISLILLGGGRGSRMNLATPKQFLPLKGKPLILHSFETFLSFPFLNELIIVCSEEYRSFFPKAENIHFALPGARRQDSLQNGFEKISLSSDLVCIHDAARPFVEEQSLKELIQNALKTGAATLGMPIPFTIKECNLERTVIRTLKRDTLWEIQTPQAIQTSLLQEALHYASLHQLEVTDDVSLVETYGKPVKVVMGFSDNLKVTYPCDLALAEKIYERRKEKV